MCYCLLNKISPVHIYIVQSRREGAREREKDENLGDLLAEVSHNVAMDER